MELLGFIGGTGPEGMGLAARFAAAGEAVLIGSRSPERAAEAVGRLRQLLPEARIEGGLNEEVAARADILFLTIPYDGQQELLPRLAAASAGKIVVSTVSALRVERGRVYARPVPAGSAAEEAAELLPGARVVGAFHHVGAHQLLDLGYRLDCDVLVAGDDREAKEAVLALGRRIPGIRTLDAGGLYMCRYLEVFTAVLLSLNRRYRTTTTLKIVGIDG